MEEIISLTSDEVAARLLKKFKESLARKAAGESSSSELPPLKKVKTEPAEGTEGNQEQSLAPREEAAGGASRPGEAVT